MSNQFTPLNGNAEKREFIGGIVASVLIKKGAEKVIEHALDKMAKKDTVPMAKEAVAPAKEEVLKGLKDEVQARAEHQLDIEPHWSSRNVWASFVGLITAANTILIFWTDNKVQGWEEWQIPLGILFTALVPMWSRFVAKKPLFR